MKVRIIKCSGPYWYQDHIGEEYEVEESVEDGNKIYRADGCGIAPDDVEIVEETEKERLMAHFRRWSKSNKPDTTGRQKLREHFQKAQEELSAAWLLFHEGVSTRKSIADIIVDLQQAIAIIDRDK